MSNEELNERIEKVSRYANKVYYSNYNRFCFYGEEFEDFKNSLILLSLEYPEDSNFMLFSRYRYFKRCPNEAIQYQITNMRPFSSFDDYEDLIENIIGGKEDEHFKNSFKNIEDIASLLYSDNEEMQNKCLDFFFGVSCGSDKNRQIRKRCFKYRFEILDILYNSGFLCYEEYLRFLKLSKELKTVPKVAKTLKENSSNIAVRKYYEKNKEKIKAKHKENRQKLKSKEVI